MRAPSLDDAPLTELIAAQCSSLTPELEMKWAAVSPYKGAFEIDHGDRLVAFAQRHGLAIRGHALVWHAALPRWISDDGDWRTVERHIVRLAGRYRRQIAEWDVVNEPIADGGLRGGWMLDQFGPTYIDRSFHAAHEAAPDAQLFLNEHDLEYAVPEQKERRDALLALVRRLLRDGVPLHGVGLQGHLAIGRGSLDRTVLGDFLAALADLGLTLAVTELDVKERHYILPAEERDSHAADHVAHFLDIVLDQPAIRSLTCWGLSDRQSWLEVTDADRARFPGAWQDGTDPGLNRGLPYDAALRPKSLRTAIALSLDALRR